jgi:hypothetical protein
MPPSTRDGGLSPTRTVHQLLRQLAPDYLERFGSAMPGRQRRVLLKILACRTPALGGQLFQCPGCASFDYRYHSCNDRHCPQCGQSDADAWLQRQRGRLLLPSPYFLLTFTVPQELRMFIRSHLQIALDLLFATSAQALQDLAANPRKLGARLAMLGVLHTWSRSLAFHPHIHYLVPAGGLTHDGRCWIASRRDFLLPVKALGAHVRTLFKERLLKEHPALFAQVPAQVWKRHWNVDSRAAGSGENALAYLSRYIFKTATSNRPVQRLPSGQLRWPYRESKTGRQTSVLLEPAEFLRRFLQHILPPHFARVRSFGWFHPAAKVRLNRVRALLHRPPLLRPLEEKTWNPSPDPTSPPQPPVAPAATSCPVPSCPRCQQPMRLIGSWRASRAWVLPNRPP